MPRLQLHQNNLCVFSYQENKKIPLQYLTCAIHSGKRHELTYFPPQVPLTNLNTYCSYLPLVTSLFLSKLLLFVAVLLVMCFLLVFLLDNLVFKFIFAKISFKKLQQFDLILFKICIAFIFCCIGMYRNIVPLAGQY